MNTSFFFFFFFQAEDGIRDWSVTGVQTCALPIWTVKRYLETGAQPVYRRQRMPSKLDEFKPLIDQWLAATPGLLATRIHQDLVRDYGFEGGYNTVRRYVERSRPRPTPRQE